MAVSNSGFCTLHNRLPYNPPLWVTDRISAEVIPETRIRLFNGPTPIHNFNIPGLENSGLISYIKRDDLTSFDMSGNKVRKLEFLMAEALGAEVPHDSVITIGGIQSNHARATAVACRQLGLNPYLILRTDEKAEDVEFVGNLLFNRMMGADIRLVSRGTFARIGRVSLTEQLAAELRKEGKNPYVIPVGGSCALSCFGIFDVVQEIISHGLDFDHLAFACGSGGTAAGLAIGMHLSGHKAELHAIGVCDSPSYFYGHINETIEGLGLHDLKAEDLLSVYSGQGLGYAKSTDEELNFIKKVSTTTGILLDPVYSGKALSHFVSVVNSRPDLFKKGQKILFLHTGGQLGLYEKSTQLSSIFNDGLISKLKVSDKS